MVSEEQLAALDVTLWQGSTERATEFDFTNQSTVSRRHHKVLNQFGIELKRTKSVLEASVDLHLLDMERQVHQMARLKRRRNLRLQVPFWLLNSPGLVLPEEWRFTRRGRNSAVQIQSRWCANMFWMPAWPGPLSPPPIVMISSFLSCTIARSTSHFWAGTIRAKATSKTVSNGAWRTAICN